MKIHNMKTEAIQAALSSLRNPKAYDSGKKNGNEEPIMVRPKAQDNSAYAGHLRSELKARGAL